MKGIEYIKRSKVRYLIFNALAEKPLLFIDIVKKTGLTFYSARDGVDMLRHNNIVRSQPIRGKNEKLYGLTPEGFQMLEEIEKK